MEQNRGHTKLWFLHSRMGRSLLALLLLASLGPLLIAGWFALETGERSLREQTRFALRASVRAAEGQLREFLYRMKQGTTAFASDPGVTDLLKQVQKRNNPAEFKDLLVQMCEWRLRVIPDVDEFFVMSPEGMIIGSSVHSRLWEESGQADYFRNGRSGFYYGDIVAEEDGTARWIMTAPAVDPETKQLLGVVGCRISLERLNDLTTGRRVLNLGAREQALRIGETGETYLVNRHKRIITETRTFTNEPLQMEADSYPVRMALTERKEVSTQYEDYRGRTVWGASVMIPELEWTLLTEIDFSQAFAPIQQLRRGLILVALGLAIIITLFALVWTGRIMRPLLMLRRADRALAQGDEAGAIVPEERLPNNELGDFVRIRNGRIKEFFARKRELCMEQERRTKATAELDRISYSIVHDMRAPLRAITSFGKILFEEIGGRLDAEQRDYLSRMIAASSRMDRLITDMLSYSRLIREDMPLSAIDLEHLVHEMVETYPSLAALRGHIEFGSPLPKVQGNDAALSQCFARILENALKFSKPRETAEVRIESEERDGKMRIWIRDNGIGMPQHMQDKVFGIFQQGAVSQDTTGIGLALVRAAVDAMGGNVGVESEVGVGSRFWIELDKAGQAAGLADIV